MIPLVGPEARAGEEHGSTVAQQEDGGTVREAGVHPVHGLGRNVQNNHVTQQGPANAQPFPWQSSIPMNYTQGQQQQQQQQHQHQPIHSGLPCAGPSLESTMKYETIQHQTGLSLAILSQQIQILVLFPLLHQQLHQTLHLLQEYLPTGNHVPFSSPFSPPPPLNTNNSGSTTTWPSIPLQEQQHRQRQLLILMTAQLTTIAWALQQYSALSHPTATTAPTTTASASEQNARAASATAGTFQSSTVQPPPQFPVAPISSDTSTMQGGQYQQHNIPQSHVYANTYNQILGFLQASFAARPSTSAETVTVPSAMQATSSPVGTSQGPPMAQQAPQPCNAFANVVAQSSATTARSEASSSVHQVARTNTRDATTAAAVALSQSTTIQTDGNSTAVIPAKNVSDEKEEEDEEKQEESSEAGTAPKRRRYNPDCA